MPLFGITTLHPRYDISEDKIYEFFFTLDEQNRCDWEKKERKMHGKGKKSKKKMMKWLERTMEKQEKTFKKLKNHQQNRKKNEKGLKNKTSIEKFKKGE